MASNTYLKIDGIDGESSDDKHQKWMELMSYSLGASQPTSAVASSSGGGTTEKVSISDLSVSKLMDLASPKLFDACCTGKHFGTITLQSCRSAGGTGDAVVFYELKLTNAVISNISIGGGDGTPTETISFNFAKLEQTYTQQKRTDGTGGGNTSQVWVCR